MVPQNPKTPYYRNSLIKSLFLLLFVRLESRSVSLVHSSCFAVSLSQLPCCFFLSVLFEHISSAFVLLHLSSLLKLQFFLPKSLRNSCSSLTHTCNVRHNFTIFLEVLEHLLFCRFILVFWFFAFLFLFRFLFKFFLFSLYIIFLLFLASFFKLTLVFKRILLLFDISF